MNNKKSINIFMIIIFFLFICYLLNNYFKINLKNYLTNLNKILFEKDMNIIQEQFIDLQPADISYKMGEYDSNRLSNSENEDIWRNHPDKPLNEKLLFTPQGTPVSPSPTISDMNQDGPFVDGVPTSQKSMFIFSQNKTSFDCCPSTYSTDTGCVCTTKKQREFLAARGNNRSLLDNNEF